jgi:hypothetical protein
MLAPEDRHQRLCRDDPQQASKGIDHWHGGEAMLDSQSDDMFLVLVGINCRWPDGYHIAQEPILRQQQQVGQWDKSVQAPLVVNDVDGIERIECMTREAPQNRSHAFVTAGDGDTCDQVLTCRLEGHGIVFKSSRASMIFAATDVIGPHRPLLVITSPLALRW